MTAQPAQTAPMNNAVSALEDAEDIARSLARFVWFLSVIVVVARGAQMEA